MPSRPGTGPDVNPDEAAIRAYLDQIRSRIDRHGWAMVSTESPEPEHGGALLAYTVGCSNTLGRPEVFTLGLPPYLAQYCLERLVERWRHDPQEHEAGSGGRLPGILEGHDVILLPVPAARAAPLLRVAPHLLPGPFRTLQLVWPDADGRFPWDPACDPAVVGGQPVLGQPGPDT